MCPIARIQGPAFGGSLIVGAHLLSPERRKPRVRENSRLSYITRKCGLDAGLASLNSIAQPGFNASGSRPGHVKEAWLSGAVIGQEESFAGDDGVAG
jgi:hypothetical protein